MRFADRRAAGRQLAAALATAALADPVVVLGLPRGGVPVAAEVAAALSAPLDVFVVRKLGVPRHRELAFGAVASGGVRVLNQAVVDAHRLTDDEIARGTEEETAELLRRERDYRGERPAVPLSGVHAVIVDDGLATGASMRAAAQAVRQAGASRVTCAVPVGPPSVRRDLGDVVDDVVCVLTPSHFSAVGQFYVDFTQIDDREVRRLLQH